MNSESEAKTVMGKDPEFGGWLQQGGRWGYKLMDDKDSAGKVRILEGKKFWNLQKEARTQRQKKTVLLKCAKLPLHA